MSDTHASTVGGPAGDGASLQQRPEPGPPVYLDFNATTPVRPEVFAAMRPWLEQSWGNPSSAHAYGREAARAVALARAQVAALIGAESQELLFTSCGTESDNLAIFGLGPEQGARIVTSSIEHPAIEAAAAQRERLGAQWQRLGTDTQGRVQLDDPKLGTPHDLLSVILAHNETGVVQPVAELAARARAVNSAVLVHTDAAQALGKIPVDVQRLGIDALTVVGHKLYAPKGVGALYLRTGTKLRPMLFGGGQEAGLRPGTEAVAQIVALGSACALAREGLADFGSRVGELRERLWARLHAGIANLHRTVPEQVDTLPNTLHVCVPGLDGRALLAAAPGLAASTGSACHADSDAVPGVLGEMGLPATLARGALRLSLGHSTSAAEVDTAAALLVRAVHALHAAQALS